MIRIPRILFLVTLFAISGVLQSSCTTTSRSCNLKINKKKLNYYNSLQYKGASRKRR